MYCISWLATKFFFSSISEIWPDIRGVVFSGRNLIRGVVFSGRKLIRGVIFSGRNLIRGLL
jgi:hypothetical protein